jgi:hypothetical protein
MSIHIYQRKKLYSSVAEMDFEGTKDGHNSYFFKNLHILRFAQQTRQLTLASSTLADRALVSPSLHVPFLRASKNPWQHEMR